IGKNGAGKSTLLKLLARITEPSSGRIEIGGKLSAMLEVGTGFNAELTGRENVYLNGAILGMKKSEIDRKFDQIADFSEIGPFIDMPVKRYSSGMYVRLAFAVASHLEPDILILDEVFAVGDQKFRQKCLDRINEILQGDKTILCVSHQMDLIRELCDRVIVLDRGKIVYDGDTESAIEFYGKNQTQNSKAFFDLTEAARPSFLRQKALMESLEIKNRNEFMGGKDNILSFEISLKALEDLADVKLRLMVRYYDDTKAGFAQLSRGLNIKEGQTVKQNLTFDTSSLFPGKYIAGLALFSSDSTGKAEHFDYIREAFSFEIPEDGQADKSISYSHRDWGHVFLGELESR
ncbi:MAG TPA: ABC transporter ATP-binding protein, partial [Oscillospiraceae bacterium]|nr:ABC transporter ATP-binding protein [Oscillospiraceae bacterium]